MLKITLEIHENKDKDNCTVKITNQKDLSKATEHEKRAGAIVRNQLEKILSELQHEEK